MTRIGELREAYKKEVENFGSPEHNMAERRKILRNLRKYEQEMDRYYKLRE